jgi:Zn-dependent metalloprotease
MMGVRKYFLIMLLVVFCINVSSYAQKRAREYNPAFLNSEMKLDESGKMPIAIRFKEGENLRINNFFEEYRKTFSLPDETEMRLYRSFSDEFSQTHHRYNQYYKGVQIVGAQYILHEKAGYVHFANGRLVHRLELEVTPVLTEQQALDVALGAVGAESYMWESAANEAFLKKEQNDPQATFYPRGKLKLSSGNKDLLAENIHLVYRFDIYAEKPLGRYFVDTDAKTGEIVSKISRMHSVDVPGTGQSQYNGLVNITVDSFTGTTGTAYRLRETGRSGIQTYDMQSGVNYLNAVDFVDADLNFTDPNAVAGVSSHWAMEAAYDYFLNTHGRDSYDGSGATILNYAHYGVEVNDAFWDGSRFTFGDGDDWMYRPMVSLDIAGHEFSHAVVEHSAGLIYANESGALSESFSDIFAAAIEFYEEGANGDWLIGEDVTLQNPALRSLDDPNSYEQPDTYLGNYWAPLSTNPEPGNDYGGVHTNGGVHNYWFYLLAQGGSGVNDFGDPYSVSGIGFQDAALIAYRNLKVYITPSARYPDAREGAIQAAIDLFGAASSKVEAVRDAWNAVGVGDPPPPASILVWDGILNGQDYSGAYISNYLTNAGFTVNYTDVFPASMIGYDAVFLSFGNYGSSGSTLTEFTAGMASVVKTYLEAGGNVYLEGGDALGFDQSSNFALLNLFGLFSAQDGDQNSINGLQGQDGAITDGMLFTSSSQVNTDYIDRYTPNNGTEAFFESSYDNVAVQYIGTLGQRTFCFSYALAGLNNGASPSTKDDLMAALVAFLIPGTPEIVLSPTSFNLSVPVGDSTTAILGIYNTGSSLLNWSIRDQSDTLQLSNGRRIPVTVRQKEFRNKPARDIFDSQEWAEKFRNATRLSDLLRGSKPPVTEEIGDILDTFTAPGTPAPVGIAYDPDSDAVWVTDESGGKVFRVAKTPPYSVLQTITLSVGFSAGPYDISVKGDTLYISDFNGSGSVNDAIYAINKNTGALIELWQLDGPNNPNLSDAIDQVMGITVNDAGEIFVSNNVTKTIRKIALMSGGMWQTLQTFESPVGKRTAGLHWDPEQNGFWVANIVNEPVFLTDANFNKVDSFPEPGNLSSGITSLGNTIVWVSDFGSGEIYVIEGALPPCPWISETPRLGSVATHNNQNVELLIDASQLSPGTYACNLFVSSDDPDESLLTIPVTLNVIPVNEPPTLTPILDQVINEGDTLLVPVVATDPDFNSNTVVLRSKNLPAFADFADSGDGTGILGFRPGYFDAGIYPNIQIISMDNGIPALSDTTTFTLTVNNVNRAPVISVLSDTSVFEGDTLEVHVSATDLDGDSLSFSIVNFPTFGTVIDSGNGNGMVRFTPGYENAGTYLNLQVVVTDAGVPPLSDNSTFRLVVHNINRAPVFAEIPDTATAEGDTLEMIVSATDPDGNNITLSTVNLLPFGSFSDNGNGSGNFVFTPGFSSAGNYLIDVIATDDGIPALGDTATFMLTVNGTNRAPIITAIGDQLINEGQILSVPVTAVDPDGDSISFSMNNLPLFATFVDSGNGHGIIHFAPGFDDAGVYENIQVIATDNGIPPLFGQEVFRLTVNDGPDVSGLPDSLSFDADSSYMLNVWEAVNDPETPDSLLDYEFLAVPDTLELSFDPSTGLLNIAAKNKIDGVTADLEVTVSDPQGASSAKTISVRVIPLLGIDDNFFSQIPREYSLVQNYPNPFNPTTQIRYGLPRAGKVKIQVVNILGQTVATLVNDYKLAGYHEVTFDARNLASGMYFYHIQTGEFQAVKKMILLK